MMVAVASVVERAERAVGMEDVVGSGSTTAYTQIHPQFLLQHHSSVRSSMNYIGSS